MTVVQSAPLSRFKPYDGAHHTLPDGCPKILSTFSGDVSGRVRYAFNSLGFRGDEFDETADRHIFVAGCSITFGLGLDDADTWGAVFRRGYATIHQTAVDRVNLMNFSTSGCSNGFITRTLIAQCERARPTLALALLTLADRAELLHAGRSYNIGRWCTKDAFDDGAVADGHDRELRQLIRNKAKAHYDLYNQLAGEQDLLKNALLLQWYFQTRGLPFLIGVVRLGDGALPVHPMLTSWLELLDLRHVFPIAYEACLVDESVAPGHPGVDGARLIAETFLSRYRDLPAPTPRLRDARPPVTGLATDASAGGGESSDASTVPSHEDPNIYPLF
jgi:hypothetical protein